MTASNSRIGLLASIYLAALGVILVHLWILMVHEQQVWERRSYENVWAFRSVPSRRGDLLDRNGALLAADVATTQVSIYYQQFRRYNVIGAVMHGASTWRFVAPDDRNDEFRYADPEHGPLQAARTLFAIPVAALRPGLLDGNVGRELRTYVVVALAGCAQLTRAEVYKAMREAWEADLPVVVGDVLEGVARAELQAAFELRWRELDAFGVGLERYQRAAAERDGRSDESVRPLLVKLDELRQHAVRHQRLRSSSASDGLGAEFEDIRWVFADDVPFAYSARLRTERELFLGLDVEPAVRRQRYVRRGTSIDRVLGEVRPIDDLMHTGSSGERVDPPWLRMHQFERWGAIFDMATDAPVDTRDDYQHVLELVRDRYRAAMLRFERRGMRGLERQGDVVLSGELGMRFVEQGRRRKEQLLWGHLDVEAGRPVRASFDIELQNLAEQAVVAWSETYRARQRDQFRDLVQAGMCLVDVNTGDVLACAGAPLPSDGVGPHVIPGLTWVSSGAVGSVLKPFVLVEQLEAELTGRPHLSTAAVERCDNAFEWGTRRLRCSAPHGERGADAVQALAKSCNEFFYQVAVGLGQQGVDRARQRFGLMADPGGEFDGRMQPKLASLPGHQPNIDAARILPQQAIGYGSDISMLDLVRAYAALATGVLPTLGTMHGARRAALPLGVHEQTLEVVRRGLQRCLIDGTGRKLEVLRELGAFGKSGTAEVGAASNRDNNAWFAGFLPQAGASGVQLAFCAVVYRVPDKYGGATVAGNMLDSFFGEVAKSDVLRRRYLVPADAGRAVEASGSGAGGGR